MADEPLDSSTTKRVMTAIARAPFFQALAPEALDKGVAFGKLVRYPAGEALVTQGDPSDSFLILLRGEASVRVVSKKGEANEVARLGPNDSLGEMGLLLQSKRSATVVACEMETALKFDLAIFMKMFQVIPHFGFGICRTLASRLSAADRQMAIPPSRGDAPKATPNARDALPMEFIRRHRVIPLQIDGNALRVAIVNDPTPQVIQAIRQHLPGMEMRMVRVDAAAVDGFIKADAMAPTAARGSEVDS